MDLLAEGSVTDEEIESWERCSLPRGTYVTERFQKKVVETVNTMLKRGIRRFNHRLSEVMENNETENAEILLIRMRKDLNRCFFFRKMRFLDAGFADELEQALLTQIRLFLKSEIREIRHINEITANPNLEEMMYSMKRFAREYEE